MNVEIISSDDLWENVVNNKVHEINWIVENKLTRFSLCLTISNYYLSLALEMKCSKDLRPSSFEGVLLNTVESVNSYYY